MKKMAIIFWIFLFIQPHVPKQRIPSGSGGFLFGDESEMKKNPAGVVSTFIGGTETDDAYEPSIVLGHDGHVYISGFTVSKDYPVTKNAFDEEFNGGTTDRFISKLSRDLKVLMSSTYIGGKGLSSPYIGGNGDELGHAVAVDPDGNVYIAGYTESPDFPVTDGAYDTSYNGGRDVYVSKFDRELTRLLASTFVGGTGDEGYMWPRIDMTVDEKGDVYVAGLTHSVDFPTTDDAFDRTFNGGPTGGDVFIFKISGDLTTLHGSTYLGGSHNEWRVSVVIGQKNQVFVCGETESTDFPTTAGAYSRNIRVMKDVFISRFNDDLTELGASTLFGGSELDEALSLEVSGGGDVFIAGYTQSKDFPTTEKAYMREWSGGDRDAFLAKFSNDLRHLMASTLFGGSARDMARDLALASDGDIFVTGFTFSADFPVTKKILNRRMSPGKDFFVSKFDQRLEKLTGSAVLGGSKDDDACSLVFDGVEHLFVAGKTSSPDLPVSEDGYDNTFNGGFNDCFLFKLNISVLK